MKKNYFKFLLGIALAINLNVEAQTNDCNELFISEIVYAKDSIAVSGNSSIINSYAIELFNPRGTDIDLTGYYIKLVRSNNSGVDINLLGNVSAKGTFTIGFSGADSSLQQVADYITSSLDFNEKLRLELWGVNGIIDRIGAVNLSQADQINIAAAIADPINYLNTLDIDLRTLKNFTARRKFNVNQGDSTFTNPASNWTVAPNGDITNVGQFYNICVEDVKYWIYECQEQAIDEGYWIYVEVFADGINDNTIGHSVKLQLYNDQTGNKCFQTFFAPSADLSDANLHYPNQTSPSSASYTVQFTDIASGFSLPSKTVYVKVVDDNISESAEHLGLLLSTPNNGSFYQDIFNDDIKIMTSFYINDLPSGIVTLDAEKLNINTYPNPFNETIFLNNKSEFKIQKIELINSFGQTVLEENYPETTISTSNISSGFYSIKFTTNDKVLFKKMVKE
jgi:hypothetical protein